MNGSLRVLLAILVAASLGACSSAGGVAPFASGAQDAGTNRTVKSELVLRVRVPHRKKTQRGARYISAGTKALTMSFTGPQTLTQVVNLTPADPRCSGSPLICTITIHLIPGSYTAAIKTYDEAPVNGEIPAGAKLLSTAAGIRVVKTGTVNRLALTLDGVPGSIVVASFAPADAGSGFLNKSFSVTVLDADGYMIVGTYSTPVVLSNSDTTGATAVTTTGSDNPPAHTLLSTGDTALLSYSGQSIIPARITATSGSASGFSVFEVFLPTYVADNANNAVKEIPIGCGDPSCIITIGGGFVAPHDVALDASGNVYVSDFGNNKVKEIPPGCYSSSCVATIGGGFDQPWGIGVDHAGNVFVTDFGSGAVKKIPPGCTSGACVVIAGGGFDDPAGVTVDQSGTVFVADTFNNEIKSMAASCGSASCVTTRNTGAALATPVSIALDGAGNAYVAEPLSNKVLEVPAACNAASCVVTIGGGFSLPYGVTADWQSDVFVADSGNNAAKLVPPGCTASVCVTTYGTGFSSPLGIGIF